MVEFSQIKLVLNVLNMIVTLLISAAGFQVTFFSGGDGRTIILGIYVLFFGILATIMEVFHIRMIEQYFFFYWLALGRSFFFVFLGVLLLGGGGGLVLAAAILSLIMGGVFIVIRLLKMSVIPPLFYKESLAPAAAPTQ